jgi:8-oxo-dGTP pyrophosphatase MutT (NUDIX family)
METTWRPAVRIICLDVDGRVLLMCWRDPHDGALIWEPPGGGIEAGESPFETARRELAEETGLDPDSIVDSPLLVDRDTTWKGKRYVGTEEFYLARYPSAQPALGRDGLMVDEQQNLTDHRWLHLSELSTLDGRLEPPQLAEVVTELGAR